MRKPVKLTNAERIRALAEARADGCKFADCVIIEMAEEDKRQAIDEAEKSELVALRKRVAKLERLIGPDCKRVIDSIAHAVGKTLPKYIEQQGLTRFAGIYDPGRTYRKGEMVTHDTGTWVAVDKASHGERPGKSIAWRLAGSSVIGALRVVLGADTAAFDKGLKGSESSLDKFGRQAKIAGAAIGTALVGAATALGVAVVKTINHADELGKTAQKIGIPVEELSRLSHAADLSGVSFDTLTGSFTRLSRNMADVAAGSGAEARRAFEGLGIAVTEADGSLKSSSKVMEEVADRFASMEDGAQKTAAATQIFGRAGAELIPMLNQGAEGIQKMKDEADQLGIVISGNTAAAAERFNDNLERLRKVFDGYIVQVTAALAEPLAQLSDWLVDSAKKTNELTDAHNNLQQAVAGMIGFVMREVASFRELSSEIATLQKVVDHFGEGEFMAGWQAWHNNIAASKERAAELEEAIARLNSPLTQLSSSVDNYVALLITGDAPQDNFTANLDAAAAAAERAKASQDQLNQAQRDADTILHAIQTPAQNYQDELARINKLHQMGMLDAEAYQKALQQAAENAGATWRQAAKSISGSFVLVANEFGKSSKGIAKAGKAFAIVNAVISMWEGAAKALAMPWPANLAAAASVIARGLVFVSNIKSQQIPSFAQGGSFTVPGGISGVDNITMPLNLASGERVDITPANENREGRRGDFVVNMRPGRYSRDELRSLFGDVNEWIKDGGTGIRAA